MIDCSLQCLLLKDECDAVKYEDGNECQLGQIISSDAKLGSTTVIKKGNTEFILP